MKSAPDNQTPIQDAESVRRQDLAEALLRGEAVCYGMRFEQAEDGFYIDAGSSSSKAYVENCAFIGLGGPVWVGTRNDGHD